MSIHSNFAPRNDESDEYLARACIERQKTPNDTPESLSWTWERFRYLTEYLPDKAWKVIKLIVVMDNSAETINNLVNGHLDDLLGNFGTDMIDLVEAEISRLPELQPLLVHAQELGERRASWVRSEHGFYGRARDGSIGQELAPHEDESDEELARAWVALQTEQDSDRHNSLWWSWERMNYLITYLPQRAWHVILLIWSIDQSIKTMQNLSTGPIEDLLSKHGPAIISLVEAEARCNPTFAKLLGGVWKFQMTDEVWTRLQAVWDRRDWDGVPEA